MPGDIYLYDINTKKEIPICENDEHQLFPDIYGNKVVWVDQRDDPVGDIYMYDSSTNETVPICEKAGSLITPKIYGNKIIWCDYRNGNWDIYLYTNESVNVPTQDQQDDQNIQNIQELLEQYRYILITIIVAVAVLVPFVYYKIKTRKLKHEK